MRSLTTLVTSMNRQNPPHSPFLKGGQSTTNRFPLFEKEGSGEIFYKVIG